MGEYVEIKTSVSEIIGIANGLRSKGESLQQAATAAETQIRQLEERRETFPADDFTDAFLQIYKQNTEAVDGKPTTVNVAVTGAAKDMGKRLSEIGTFVADAMWNYSATDDDSGADIKKTPLP
jgi:hypothetical protein